MEARGTTGQQFNITIKKALGWKSKSKAATSHVRVREIVNKASPKLDCWLGMVRMRLSCIGGIYEC